MEEDPSKKNTSQKTVEKKMPKAQAPSEADESITVKPRDEGGEEEEGEDENLAEDMLKAGKKIKRDDFKIVKVIGKGSFGKVFLVKKKDCGDKVYAMKVLNKAMVAKRNLVVKT